MITLTSKGDFKKTLNFLEKLDHMQVRSILNKYGEKGVVLLREATPKRSGRTASMWHYEISESDGHYEIVWLNENINKGVNIALIIQYGHGTRNGGYVRATDYINPVLEEVFREMADEIWREVTKA